MCFMGCLFWWYFCYGFGLVSVFLAHVNVCGELVPATVGK